MRPRATSRATGGICLFVCSALWLSCGTGNGSHANGTKLTQILITPANRSIARGTTLQLSAVGTLADGNPETLTTNVTWTISPSNIGTVDEQGVVKALAEGVAQVSATYQGITGTTSTTVGPPNFLNLSVGSERPTLPLGESELMSAVGSFSDGTTQVLTNLVSWQVTPPTIASIDPHGNLKSLSKGVVKVSASYKDMNASAAVTVGTAALISIAVAGKQSSLPVGESESFSATGTFSDGTMQTLTQLVEWNSSQSAIASVSSTGSVLGKSVGTSTITAAAGPVTGSGNVSVTAAVPVSLSITPASSSLILGNTAQLAATATYSDGSTKDWTTTATWTSSPLILVAVSNTGLVTAQQVGTANVTANSSGLSASASLTVTPLMMVSYFNRANSASTGFDGTIRLINPAFPPGGLCAMVYVFDQNQELNECCGCHISDDGLVTLSLLHDLTANTLTGKKPVAGEIEIVPSNPTQGGECNAGSLSPNGLLVGTETNVQNTTAPLEVTETPFPLLTLSGTQAQVLAAECSLVQQLGSGQGVCTCGTGD
jgi:uncharacterized protein YjdB